MGNIRVTQSLIILRSLYNLQTQMREIMGLQEQLATGQKVNSPSDDPVNARRAIDTRTVIQKNEQYLDNISSVGPQLEESSASMLAIVSALQRVQELTIQAANDTNVQQQLDQIAIEINQLLEGVLVQANHETNGRYVFGGTRTMAPPYVATRNANGDITAISYVGNDEHIYVAISDGIDVVANETGADAFQSTQDIFQLLIDIRDDMVAGDQNSLRDVRLDELDVTQDQLLVSMARVGSVQNRLERAASDIEDFMIQYQKLLSDTLDADFGDVVVKLNAQSNAYQAALNAAARVIQPSLLDYVR
ncbi:MAG TPA: flagellar hook-associated protein FlgL [Candidatus Hydrogenedentes bacterium]|nr:flagellar hook-associated protein FlgL [Candidatus Hydrogenedentota bacterium]